MFLKQAIQYNNPFWMYLLGSFVILIFNIIGQFPLTYVIMKQGPTVPGGDPMEVMRNIDKNVQFFLLLIPFVIGFLGLWLVVKKLHERSLISISTARKQIDWRRIIYAFLIWALITILLITINYVLNPNSYIWNFNIQRFVILFFIAIFLVPFQTSLEEYIFRGYLMQGFGGIFKNAWAPLLITSFIFGSLHLFNPEVEKLGYGILTYYVGTGLFLGIMTLMDDGIELALGFHAANNLITALLVTSNWTAFQTESILIDVSEPSLGSELLLSIFLFYPLFLVIMSKKYEWNSWKSKLTMIL
ncbi:MAG: CPBP family intramembrane metalloprotease domain-containing protein [Flavobacteriaceae bacterium]|nr:CPBP family intramembrane metalloprotease domain-containing protein [Flavobacteriaceae bacterium]